MTDVIDTHDVDAPSLGVIQEAVRKLTKDERFAGIVLGKDEARFLVDAYYQLQDNRIRNDAQVRSMAKDGEPHAVIQWLADMNRTLEDQIKAALDVYSANDPVGKWLRAQVGIGPVIAAGLLAHLDITKAETAGAFWSFAGMEPSKVWHKGEKRPWNAALKVLGAITFVVLNGVLLRTLHHYADIPFRFDAMMRSVLVQAAFSLFWTLLALVAMVMATRR